jgi:IS605 OrfB family transposase
MHRNGARPVRRGEVDVAPGKSNASSRNARPPTLHKLTTRLIRENQVVCIESLAVKNLLHNHSLAKSIADVGWGELIRQLAYKARWYGRTLVPIDRFTPSSKRCHGCGYLLDDLDLEVREWTCPNCSLVHDRDLNAALNVKAAGLAVFACGEKVETKPAWHQGRLDSTKQENPPCEGWNLLPFRGARGCQDVLCSLGKAARGYMISERSPNSCHR